MRVFNTITLRQLEICLQCTELKTELNHLLSCQRIYLSTHQIVQIYNWYNKKINVASFKIFLLPIISKQNHKCVFKTSHHVCFLSGKFVYTTSVCGFVWDWGRKQTWKRLKVSENKNLLWHNIQELFSEVHKACWCLINSKAQAGDQNKHLWNTSHD